MDHFQHHVTFSVTSVLTSIRLWLPGVLLWKENSQRLVVISILQFLCWSGNNRLDRYICPGCLSVEEAPDRMLQPLSGQSGVETGTAKWGENINYPDTFRTRLNWKVQNLASEAARLRRRTFKANSPLHKSDKLMLWWDCGHCWFEVWPPCSKAITKTY